MKCPVINIVIMIFFLFILAIVVISKNDYLTLSKSLLRLDALFWMSFPEIGLCHAACSLYDIDYIP